MASLLSLCLFLVALQQKADPYAHSSLLAYYQTATKDEGIARKFITLMDNYQGRDPLKLGYKAVSHAIMAKHVWSPYAKMKYLRQSSQIFEEAVALDKHDPEVRFLRFSIENYIPRYLNMSNNLAEDKKVFMAAIMRHPRSGISSETVKIMRDFLVRKDLLTKQEQQQMEKINL
ncbi:hypothetical protein ACD591_20540 [Rufibacter glacialis]|uniref:Uncharacterized protein n=1 Tax=Rufibacter glacialis TaxID=1259555 RepID=A0A5M8QCV0_9BACT|nr:hypothetical protein [Rufibacter glacialis]KAA6432282.1 hypothetical protein FOE74_14310 [Rufibacter glacialis]